MAHSSGSEASAPASKNRRLSDIKLSDQLTQKQVVTIWGEALKYGPGNIINLYGLDNGERLWLSFESNEAGNLNRAVLITNETVPESKILFNKIEATKNRHCNQFDFSNIVTVDQINKIWGPPDNVIGSGIENWIYYLKNGGSAILILSKDQVISVKGCQK
jgi:hypothetical protein